MTGNPEEKNRVLGFPVGPGPRRGRGDHEEKNRVLGFPVGPGPRHGRGDHEEQHVMGFPATWFDNVNVDALRWLVHPIGEYRRWTRRRRLDPHTKDAEDR